MTPAFKRHPNVLLRSVRADKAASLMQAHVDVGDLDLSTAYTERTWAVALKASALACSKDAIIIKLSFPFQGEMLGECNSHITDTRWHLELN